MFVTLKITEANQSTGKTCKTDTCSLEEHCHSDAGQRCVMMKATSCLQNSKDDPISSTLHPCRTLLIRKHRERYKLHRLNLPSI
mmetsp:Transcript_53145/g.159053  ORF Transcript_53145/g.159053 Transcript_53145/m.159053 type:complete len:84 (-) Transcript_53145:738-989(-)